MKEVYNIGWFIQWSGIKFDAIVRFGDIEDLYEGRIIIDGACRHYEMNTLASTIHPIVSKMHHWASCRENLERREHERKVKAEESQEASEGTE